MYLLKQSLLLHLYLYVCGVLAFLRSLAGWLVRVLCDSTYAIYLFVCFTVFVLLYGLCFSVLSHSVCQNSKTIRRRQGDDDRR